MVYSQYLYQVTTSSHACDANIVWWHCRARSAAGLLQTITVSSSYNIVLFKWVYAWEEGGSPVKYIFHHFTQQLHGSPIDWLWSAINKNKETIPVSPALCVHINWLNLFNRLFSYIATLPMFLAVSVVNLRVQYMQGARTLRALGCKEETSSSVGVLCLVQGHSGLCLCVSAEWLWEYFW